VSDRVRIVHRDTAFLVLDKPTGLPTTSPPGGGEALTDVAARLDPDAPALHASSRLDAAVTGLVTFARTRAANAALLEARRAGEYRRLYLALAPTVPDPASGTWSGAIGIDPREKRKRRIDAKGKPAETRYETRAALDHSALLALSPQTGRTHQLRVHAAAAGVPLLGDVHYGGAKRLTLGDGRVVTARRVMLHCARLWLPDVAAGEGTLELASPVPEDFRQVWVRLGGDAGAL
jgi:23S rRNA-/tRNA-specific pseudouridylate synthase